MVVVVLHDQNGGYEDIVWSDLSSGGLPDFKTSEIYDILEIRVSGEPDLKIVSDHTSGIAWNRRKFDRVSWFGDTAQFVFSTLVQYVEARQATKDHKQE